MYFIRDVQCIDGIAVNSQFAIGKIHADIINELVAFHLADGRCASCGECFDSDAEFRVILVVQFFLTHSHPLRSGILALCNKRWLEAFLRNRVEFTAMLELTFDLLNYRLSPLVQQFQ